MEYVILIFFIVIIVIGLMFFITFYQSTQLRAEERRLQQDRALFVMQEMLVVPALVKDDSLLDDAKLTALLADQRVCGRLEPMLGEGWYAEVKILDGRDGVACTPTNYPDCNLWQLCTPQPNEHKVAYSVPVNVYRNTGLMTGSGFSERIDLAVLTAGIRTG